MTSGTRSRRKALAFLAATMVAITVSDVAHAEALCGHPSCLGARDINGISLDMTLEQVSALFPNGLTPLGSGQFKAENGATSYDLGFSVLGHLFRIDSRQTLARFEPDRVFGLRLTQKLTDKYGPPHGNQLPDGGPAFWQFVQPYTDGSGQRLLREAESLSAMLSPTYNGPVTLDLKLMDFRILRRDEAMLNRGPEAQAEARVHF
ncbi:MAG TPA: hypothetical protein VGG10_08365 [Rhizomicrobium sp.]